jgi:5-formyltetrahydrofolate cyclo-ligase
VSSDEKDLLRHQLRATRDALPADARAAASDAIARRFAAEILVTLPERAVVALYAAKGSEVDTDPIAERCRKSGRFIVYPRVNPGARILSFHRATPRTLTPGTFGVREPRPGAPEVALADIACFVVPALGFAPGGARLGWGGGYYDATLARASGVTVGVAFECQIVPQVPVHEGDRAVQIVLTGSTASAVVR